MITNFENGARAMHLERIIERSFIENFPKGLDDDLALAVDDFPVFGLSAKNCKANIFLAGFFEYLVLALPVFEPHRKVAFVVAVHVRDSIYQNCFIFCAVTFTHAIYQSTVVTVVAPIVFYNSIDSSVTH